MSLKKKMIRFCLLICIVSGLAGSGAMADSDRTGDDEIRRLQLMIHADGYTWKAGTTGHGATVSGVYTPPALRNHGYATACVASLSQLLLDEGHEFCTLYADLSNPTSNSIYKKMGYRPIRASTAYEFIPSTGD